MLAFMCTSMIFSGSAQAQVDQQIKADIQKKLGANAKVKGVSAAPVPGLYEVLVGNEVFYTDSSNLTPVRSHSDTPKQHSQHSLTWGFKKPACFFMENNT